MDNLTKNIINYISSKELDLLRKKELLVNTETLVIELDGKEIQSWSDYILEVQNKFQFPTSCVDSIDRYLDWIRDLEWLEQKKFVIIIHNFSDFCKENPPLKNDIILDFEEIILPYWQNEVEDIAIGAKCKSFLVYIVN